MAFIKKEKNIKEIIEAHSLKDLEEECNKPKGIRRKDTDSDKSRN